MPDTERFKVTKGQLLALYNAINGIELQEVTLTAVTVEGKKGILATYTEMDRMGDTSGMLTGATGR